MNFKNIPNMFEYPRILGFLYGLFLVVVFPYILFGQPDKIFFTGASISGAIVIPLLSIITPTIVHKDDSYRYKKITFGMNIGNCFSLALLYLASLEMDIELTSKETDIFFYGIAISLFTAWLIRAWYVYDEHKCDSGIYQKLDTKKTS